MKIKIVKQRIVNILPRHRAMASVWILAACGVLCCAESMVAHAASPLPVPQLNNWKQSGDASTYFQSGNTLTINQTGQRAIYRWESFDIAHDYAVRFNQPDAGSVALNRIGGQDPSLIQGQLSANGQIYLINQNGIVFGKGAQINVNSLVASALDINDKVFNAGLLSQSAGTPVFEWQGDQAGFLNSLIRVENGAQLNAQSGGFIMLLGPRVENNGSLNTPDGTAILGAGSKVYLANASAKDQALHGILVEVDPLQGTDANGNPATYGGTATNDVQGAINAQRGNITLVGFAVNQMGRVSASTSVNQNGYVRLLARDTNVSSNYPEGSRTGNLIFGKGSVTEILPELKDDHTIQDSQLFSQSTVEGIGKTILMDEGSIIHVPSGVVNLSAQQGKVFDGVTKPANDTRIYMAAGSVIDVSGTQNVQIAADRNIVEVDLRGDVLADSPLQRYGVLYGKKVWVDIRTGTPIGDISGYVKAIGRTVAERTTEGGTVNLQSEGDIIQREGSLVDFSGGSVDYLAGQVNSTQLISQGRVYDISVATPDKIYDGIAGVYTVDHLKWGVSETFYGLNQKIFSPAYSEGKNAGTVSFVARNLVQNGNIKGEVKPGSLQRASGKVPLSGRIVIGNSAQYDQATPDFGMQDIIFESAKKLLPSDFSFKDKADQLVTLPDEFKDSVSVSTDTLRAGGIGRVAVYGNGKITLPASVTINAAPGSWRDPSASAATAPITNSVTLVGRQIDVQGAINVPSGTITMKTVTPWHDNLIDGESHGIVIGSASHLTARGAWVNDAPVVATLAVGADPLLINGGTITLNSIADLTLAQGSVLDVSGGASMDSHGKFKAGKGGSISLRTGRFGILNSTEPQHSKLALGGELRGFALSIGAVSGAGGGLEINTSSVRIGTARLSGDQPPAGELQLGADFFQTGGFSQYKINGQDAVTVASGSDIRPRVANKVLDPDFVTRPSGEDSQSFSKNQVLPQAQRLPASISLNTANQINGKLTVENGAAIRVDPTGSIELKSAKQLTLLGALEAPAGKISLSTGAPGDNDGFNSDQSIWIGSSASLISQGFAKILVNTAGLRQGEVLSGGSIVINAGKGYVVSENGSVMDVSGLGPTTVDILQEKGGEIRYTPTTVYGDAGSISISAREGAMLDGTLRGKPGGGSATGGTLSLTQYRLPVSNAAGGYPTNPVSIVVKSAGQFIPTGLKAGDEIDTAKYNGKAFVATSSFQDGGFDQLSLKSGDNIEFSGNVNLHARQNIQLDAPNLVSQVGAVVQLNAAYIGLGNSEQFRQGAIGTPSNGTGSFSAHARLIDLEGNVALQNFNQVSLESTGDIRLKGVYNSSTLALEGQFASGGNLIAKANQLYPTTLSKFTLSAADTVLIQQWEPGHGSPVLSAGGSLTVQAPNIVQSGVLKAPFGSILLEADNLTLANKSVASVSAEGMTIPYGRTQLSGQDYVYALDGTTKLILPPPEKHVQLSAPHVNMESGALVDLSGGGDLYAYEFTAGRGGSRDVLDPANAAGAYAILPWLKSDAPYDHQEYLSGSKPNVAPGDSVFLTGIDGLKSGFYTLLPTRYAMLEGAWLVTPVAGRRDMLPSQVSKQLDGSSIVPGYLATIGNDGSIIRDSRTSGFAVSPGAVARTRSEYRDTLASQFFSANVASQLPNDAGRLTVNVKADANGNSTLALNGDLLTTHGVGSRGAEVDISAPKLAVGHGGDAGTVQLDPGNLNRLGASSLLLGGTRVGTADGVTVTVDAEQVTIYGGAELAAPELILAANDKVTVKSGAKLEGKGTFSGTSKNIIVNGNGALLRTSSGNQVKITRPVSDGNATVGDLVVEDGARIVAEKSLILDATHETKIGSGAIAFGEKAAFSVGARRISLGEVGNVSEGLAFFNTDLAQFNTLANLSLISYSTVDFLGNVAFGNSALNLDIQSAGLRGFQGTQSHASIQADTFSLSNSSGNQFPAVDAAQGEGDGNLVVNANRIVLGTGREVADSNGVKQLRGVTIEGFDNVTLASSGEISGAGTGRLDVNGGNLAFQAARLTGEAASSQTITTSLAFSLGGTAPASNPGQVTALGGQINIQGQSVNLNGEIDLPSGVFAASATGDVVLDSKARINAKGVAKQFYNTVAYAPGGRVKLVSDGGNVTINTGAVVDVSGADGGDAGSLAMSAVAGTATLDGTLKGYANPDAQGTAQRQGSFILDVKTLSSFSDLNSKLVAKEDSARKKIEGGFAEEIDVRVRNGDVNVAAGDKVKAHQFSLAADGGKIDVAGEIDASGDKGGSIEMYASGNVTLTSAKLDASATQAGIETAGTAGRGGKVVLATTTGTIDIQPDTAINVSGKGTGKNGSILLRAKRNDTNTDVNITKIAGTISGAREVAVEGYQSYDKTSISSADVDTSGAMYTDASGFMGNTNTIKTRIDKTAGGIGNLHIRPGIEVTSTDDLALDTDWDLATWQFNNEPGVLTLRAAKDLNLNSNLSDGFTNAISSGKLNGGNSWSYRLAAGADLGAASPLAVKPIEQFGASKGNVNVAGIVRSGTGDITINAGRNVKLSNAQSVIYTAGQPGETIADYANYPGYNNANFPTGGGDIAISAQGNVDGAVTTQFFSDWLYRIGRVKADGTISKGTQIFKSLDTAWLIDFSHFQQNVGALGGGDVSVKAGGNVNNLSVVIPTTGRLSGKVGDLAQESNLHVTGGGDLSVLAGKDVAGGVFYVGKGTGTINAGGSVVSGHDVTLLTGEKAPLHTIFAVGNGSFQVQAGNRLDLETVLNPTILTQSNGNFNSKTGNNVGSYFFTYGTDSSVSFNAIGDISLFNNKEAIAVSAPQLFNTAQNGNRSTGETDQTGFSIYPATLNAASLQGDVTLNNAISLFPSAKGNLTLLAGGSVLIKSVLTMSDADPVQLPQPVNPFAAWAQNSIYIDYLVSTNHSDPAIHHEDNNPIRIAAFAGNVIGGQVNFPKQALISAGQDIRDLDLHGQNLRSSDITALRAGQDILFTTPRDQNGNPGATSVGLTLSGPGELALTAGRNVDMGSSKGVVTRGNLDNTVLPATGAGISVTAGVASADYTKFIERYFNVEEQGKVVNYVRQWLNNPALSDAEALEALNATVPSSARKDMSTPAFYFASQVRKKLYTELKQAGIEANKGAGYDRGYQAISTLFPGNAYRGNLNLFFSQLKTEQGGDIEIAVPGGIVNAGLANPGGFSKGASELGIVTVNGGSVRALVKNDFLVNQSRVFTLGGGDILIWSSQGNIDAGKGAKTASATPPPRIYLDTKGHLVVDTANSVAGSGIGVLLAKEGIKAGDVDLIAPKGEVNAGDAGIRAEGNLNIAALRVVGAENIQVSGNSVGIPTQSSSSVAAGLTGVSSLSDAGKGTDDPSNLASKAHNAEKAQEQLKQALNDFRPTFLTVEVIGLGE